MTRKRRYLISAAVFVASVGIVLGVLAMLPPRPGVTKANFDRIEIGMTRPEVEAILGDDYENVKTNFQLWSHADGTEVYVIFDNARVERRTIRLSTETIPDKLRRWLHLPK